MKGRVGNIFGALLLCLLATSCGSNPGSPGTLGNPVGIQLDPEMAPNEANLVREDLNSLAQLQLDGSQTPYFSDAFGGNSTADVLRYLRERVHFVLPQFTNIERRTVLPPNAPPRPFVRIPDDPGILAINYGAALWLEALIYRPGQVDFRSGGVTYPVRSARFGAIGLGPGYTDASLPSVIRLATWVHEARHSDCTGGMSGSDLALIKKGQMPVQKGCGHLHVNCPRGSRLAGLPACDDEPWGAYSIEFVFLRAVASSCSNCDAQTRASALQLAQDTASRVIVFDAMMNGSLGKPDMSSQN